MALRQQALLDDSAPARPGVVIVNDGVSIRTEGTHRMVLVHGVVFAHYDVSDRAVEAYAMVTLFQSGYADQDEIARAFGYSSRSVRRYEERLTAGGVCPLAGPVKKRTVFRGGMSGDLESDRAIIAERAMYFGTARFWDGGHESVGVFAPATTWSLAEGATGSYFDTYILVGNPNTEGTSVSFRFLRPDGQTVTRTWTVSAQSRLTVNVEQVDPLLIDTAVATTVTSDRPIVVERAMYWPGGFTTWAEAHNSFGSTETGTKWGFAEGRVGQSRNFQTYILLANATSSSAQVRITYLRESGSPVVKTYAVGPNSRQNVFINGQVPELVNENVGAVIESTNGVPISVERAMYWDALGMSWAGGTNALATRLQ